MRSGNLSYLGAANPGIYLGGLWDYSKTEIQEHLPIDLRPKHLLLSSGTNRESLEKKLDGAEIGFPLVAKPDQGERGRGVELVNDMDDLSRYLKSHREEDILIQEFIDLPVEAGILFYRIPGEKHGHISSFMLREFLTIKGDGKRTVSEILSTHPRHKRHLQSLNSFYGKKLEGIPETDRQLTLEPIGNHNRGTIFRNANRFINPELERIYTVIAQKIPDFYFGRLDIKAPDLVSLIRGERIKIIEVNGVNSEPAHIYDPDFGLFQAYRDLLKSWGLIYQISRENKKRGFNYPKGSELAKSFFRRLLA